MLKTETRTVSVRSERRTLIDAPSISKPARLSSAMAIVVVFVLALIAGFALMKVLHITTEILFGRHFPEITQRLDDPFKAP